MSEKNVQTAGREQLGDFAPAFAFLDYEKAGALVLIENIVMLIFWAFTGYQLAAVFRQSRGG